jgi:hypothetical protein
MATAIIVLQVIVGLGILNVWLVRRNWDTPFRGGRAKNMAEEFQTYGLPGWAVPVVGVFKVSLALLILGGLINPQLTALGATGLGLFMLGAVVMHVKVQDSLVQTLPAFIMLVFCGILAMGSSPDIVTLASRF